MSWLSRVLNALNPRRLDQDLAEEIRDHLERRAAALRAQGLDADQARQQTRLRFGSAPACSKKAVVFVCRRNWKARCEMFAMAGAACAMTRHSPSLQCCRWRLPLAQRRLSTPSSMPRFSGPCRSRTRAG